LILSVALFANGQSFNQAFYQVQIDRKIFELSGVKRELAKLVEELAD